MRFPFDLLRRHRARLHGAAGLFLFISAGVPAVAQAAIHVAPGGSDANPGTVALPLATIGAALAASADGDTILLADGNYAGLGNRNLDLAGRAVRIASSSQDPTACIIDCGGTPLAVTRGFVFSGTYAAAAELCGITVTGAWTSGDNDGALLLPDAASPAAAGAVPRLDRVHVVGNTGNGFHVGVNRRIFDAVDCAFAQNSGHGGTSRALHSIGGHVFERCRFADNLGSGYRSGSNVESPAQNVYLDCEFTGNGGDGLTSTGTLWQRERFERCEFSGNGANGATIRFLGEFVDCEFADNSGIGFSFQVLAGDPGSITIEGGAFERNLAGGVAVSNTSSLYGSLSISGALISDNGGPGVSATVNRTPGGLEHCLITGNAGPGVLLRPLVPPSYPQPVAETYVLGWCTIADNEGPGLACRFATGHDPLTDVIAVELDHVVIASQDTSVTAVGMVAGALTASCTDIWGHVNGDWTGALAPQLGIAGNISEDPLFCGARQPDDPWSLAADSPCADDGTGPCGLRGARSVGCPAAVSDVPVTVATAPRLYPGAPNPFNPRTTLRFDVARGGPVTLAVYDLAGRLVRTLVSGALGAGPHQAAWDGRDGSGRMVAAGAYVARLRADGVATETSLLLVK